MSWTVSEIFHDGKSYTIATNGSVFRIRSQGILAVEIQLVQDSIYGEDDFPIVPEEVNQENEVIHIPPLNRLIREE